MALQHGALLGARIDDGALPLVRVAKSIIRYQCRFCSPQGVRIRPCAKGTNSPSTAPGRDGGETRGRCATMEKKKHSLFHLIAGTPHSTTPLAVVHAVWNTEFWSSLARDILRLPGFSAPLCLAVKNYGHWILEHLPCLFHIRCALSSICCLICSLFSLLSPPGSLLS